MSRSLNVSQYIEGLNSIDESFDDSLDTFSPSNLNATHSSLPQLQQQQDDEDLAIFSNTHFFDFDMGCSTDIAVTVDDLLMKQEKQLQSTVFESSPLSTSLTSPSSFNTPHESLDLPFSSEIHDIQQFSLASELLPADSFLNNTQQQQTPSTASPASSKRKQSHSALPIKPKPSAVKAAPSLTPTIQSSLNTPNFESPISTLDNASLDAALAAASKKRTFDMAMTPSVVTATDPSPAVEVDGVVRAAADEDKRRRNTAASARFRVKKKMREQQMERTAKDLQEKVQSLETKVMQLEMENKWLKNLVVEKNEARDISDLRTMKSKIMEGVVKTEKN